MGNWLLRIIVVVLFIGYLTTFNYGGCGGGNDSSDRGSSGTPLTQVTSPNPANDATHVSITQQLGWASVSGATSYDVYFGTTSPGAFMGNQTGTTYNPGVSITSSLSWVSASGATSYDVYFGTTTGFVIPAQAGIQTTSYNPGTLNYSATYYWRIDSKNSAGMTAGNIWSFSTSLNTAPNLASIGNRLVNEGALLTFIRLSKKSLT
ncbi:MAG: hypothetical protein HY762_03545 [Planctomycetes bacterium]|nr:hypothetical protein [Planctomycetota bacterium]